MATPKRKQQKRKSPAGISDSLKTLITVASVASTLTGWGILARTDGSTAQAAAEPVPTLPPPTPTYTATPTPIATPTPDLAALQAQWQQEIEQLVNTLPPIPTLVPAPDVPDVQVRPPAQITVPTIQVPPPPPPAPAAAPASSGGGGLRPHHRLNRNCGQ
ncbi:MAG: hypothetical protein Q9O62_10700 [Ardenticatenia bacterium]|nr:hypothetical protein [Ardenticatenia bacterium]